MNMEKLVDVRNITKVFPGVTALDDISFDLYPGEVHVLVGENGAGKSTLMKILSGVYEPTSGEIVLGEKTYSSLNPSLSQELGISIIYQELSVINELSIAENLFVGRLPVKKSFGISIVDWKLINEKAAEILKLLGLKKHTSTLVEELSISEKQLVEIAKALLMDTKILIMDEPTSSLTPEEINNLFRIIKDLRNKGVGVIYISHKLDEIGQIGDRVTVFKDGKHVATKNLAEISSKEEIVMMMVGRVLQDKYLSTRIRSRQLKKLFDAIEQGYDGIGIAPLSPTNVIEAVVAANKKGIPVVNLDERIDQNRLHAAGGYIVGFANTDNYSVGAKGAQFIVDHTEPGEVAIIEGKAGNVNSEDRKEGARQVFLKNGYTVVATQAADWHRNKAIDLAAEIIKEYPNVKAFYCANDMMALGVQDLITENELAGQILVVGTDGIPAARESISRGELSATVAQNPHGIGVACFNLLLEAVQVENKGSLVQEPAIQNVDSILITTENFNEQAPIFDTFKQPVEKSLKFYFLLRTLNNPFWIALKNSIEKAAERAGVEVFVDSMEAEVEDVHKVIFEVRNISSQNDLVKNVSFKLHEHEIVGFAGLMGAGRTDLMHVIFGAEPKKTGEIFLNGEKLIIRDTYDGVKKGLGLLTENRRETGFFDNFEIYKNVSIIDQLKKSNIKGSIGLVKDKDERQQAIKQKENLSIKCTSVDQEVTKLSGGNQQKVIIGKWLTADSEVILFDEPTRGIDVGSKSEIYKIMRELANQGKGVIMVSSELPELLSVCDTIFVFKQGEISAQFTSMEATEEKIILAAT